MTESQVREILAKEREEIFLCSNDWIISRSDFFEFYIYHIKCFKDIYSFATYGNFCGVCKEIIPDNVSVTFSILNGD